MLKRVSAGFIWLALAGCLSVQAQRAPWPSEYFNPPGPPNVAGEFDYYVLVLSWSPSFCMTAERGRDDVQCARTDGRRFGFVLHGLWPQYEQGYPLRCRTPWRPVVPGPVIDSMLDIMPGKGLVIHQYREHGTCSGLRPAQYFALARQLFRRIRIPERFLNPFEVQFVAPRRLIGEFLRANPGLGPDMISITCGGQLNRLRDVRICLTKDGRPRPCTGDGGQRTRCRADDMHVPPVRSTRREDGDATP
jgi:ribonuclease T2